MNSKQVFISVLCIFCVVGRYGAVADQLKQNALNSLPTFTEIRRMPEPYQSKVKAYRTNLEAQSQKPYATLSVAENFLDPNVGTVEQWRVGLNVNATQLSTIQAAHAALMRELIAELQANPAGLADVEKQRVADIASGNTPTAISPAITGGPVPVMGVPAPVTSVGGGASGGAQRGKKRSGGRKKRAGARKSRKGGSRKGRKK